MKLLITGGAGFIGSNFVHYWVNKYPNDEISVIDSLTYAGNIENLTPVKSKVKFIESDINNRVKVAEAMVGVDAVVHFAAESHVDRSILDPAGFWHSNVHGTKVLLEEAYKAGIPRFHHISTDEVYGELPLDSDMKFSETTPYAPSPDNIYSLSKAEADNIVLDFYQNTGMHITISNCSNNYGPYQFPEKFIPIMITNLIDKIKIPIHGDGRNVRDWIHTLDHSSAIDVILQKGKKGETYLVGTNNDRSNGFIASKVVDLYGESQSVINHVPNRHSNDRRYAIDATKLITELGWKPQFKREDFDEGLKSTIQWYKNNEDWWRPLLQRESEVSDSSGRVRAFIGLDRVLGKTRFTFKETKSGVPNKENITPKDFEEENKIRYEMVMKNLEKKKWYQDSSEEIKTEVEALSLNVSTFGYVEDLSVKEDLSGEDKVIKLSKIEHAEKEYPTYGIASWFVIEDKDGGKRMEGNYSWGWGPKSGAKLLVLIKNNDEVTHIAMQREQKFPTSQIEYSLAGGFPRLNEGVLDFIIRSLNKDLAFDVFDEDLEINEVKSLGRVSPDAGMTNNRPNLYAVTISTNRFEKGNIYEENTGTIVWPIEKVQDLVSKCDDSYFLAALTRKGQ